MKFLPEQMYQLTGRNCISNFPVSHEGKDGKPGQFNTG